MEKVQARAALEGYIYIVRKELKETGLRGMCLSYRVVKGAL